MSRSVQFLVTTLSLSLSLEISGAPPITEFIKGSHLTHVRQKEDHGFVFRNAQGEVEDAYLTFAKSGATHVMMDHFVGCGYYGYEDILGQSRRANAAGLKIGINFHYSVHYQPDTIPAGWPKDMPGLVRKVYEYTSETLSRLQEEGIPIALVKVGNELDYSMDEKGKFKTGLLHPVGDADHWDDFVELLQSGIRAVRDFNPDISVLIHTMNHSASSDISFFEDLLQSGLDFDVIAKSWYALWGDELKKVDTHLGGLAEKTGKQVLVVETAYAWTQAEAGGGKNHIFRDGGHPNTKSGARNYLLELMGRVARIPGKKGVGVFAWPGAHVHVRGAKNVGGGCLEDKAFQDPEKHNINIGNTRWDNAAFWNSETGRAVSVLEVFGRTVVIGEGLVSVGLTQSPMAVPVRPKEGAWSQSRDISGRLTALGAQMHGPGGLLRRIVPFPAGEKN